MCAVHGPPACVSCRVNLRFLAEVQTLAWIGALALLLLYWLCAGLFSSAPAALEGSGAGGSSASTAAQFAHLGAGQHAHRHAYQHHHAFAGNVRGHGHAHWQQHHYTDDQQDQYRH